MTDRSLAPVVLRDGTDLILRRHERADLEAIVDQCVDPEMVRWTGVPTPYARADAEAFLQSCAQGWFQGSAASFAVEAGGLFAGSAALSLEEGRWAEVAYGLAPWARGRRVMSRSIRALALWGFGELGLRGITWRAQVGNDGARRVAEACGFQIEGTVRGLIAQRGVRADGWIGTLLAGDPVGRRPTPTERSTA